MDIDAIRTYLNTHEFEPHASGNYGFYGANLFGCDSTIMYKGQLWRLYSFSGNNADYVNMDGEHMLVSLSKKDEIAGAQRMQIKFKG